MKKRFSGSKKRTDAGAKRAAGEQESIVGAISVGARAGNDHGRADSAFEQAKVSLDKNDIVELDITDLSRAGTGVGRDPGGRAIFVPFTAPGDRVRAVIRFESERYAEAELLEVLIPSQLRVVPRCPVFGQCGGCQWQHLPYPYQWQAKIKGLRYAASRVGLEMPGDFLEAPAEQVWSYRNRIQLRGQGNSLGFFSAGSRNLVEIDRCEIADEAINMELSKIRSSSKRCGYRPFKVEVEVLPSGQVAATWNQKHAAQGFRQVHNQQNERLKQWVLVQVQRAWTALGVEKGWVYDLYGGSGNLSLGLKEVALGVDCVDVTAPGRSSGAVGFSSPEGWIRFHRMSVTTWLKRAGAQAENKNDLPTRSAASPSIAILDPSREGLGSDFQKIEQGLKKLGVARILYIGCDIDSYCRDVLKFTRNGYRLIEAGTIDLFPQTVHLESLAVLEAQPLCR